ncbi:MAG TPA: HlyD family secretion protein [Caulobacteraceae bacterium]|nr:HlyD family secretion protein [Caulobacteraceae bacterium]
MASAEALRPEPSEVAALGRPEPSSPPPSSWLRRMRWPLMIGGPLVILAVAGYFIATSGRSQSTDDAYVQANRVPISASIGGRVVEVDVRENQQVRAGQVLFRLDTRDQQATVAQDAAQLAAAQLKVTALRAAYDQQLASLATARATAAYAASEAARQKALYAAGVASRDQLDAAEHAAVVARQQVATSRQQVAGALADLGGPNLDPASQPMVQQARAALDRARLNVSYGVVVAPQDGVVTRVEQLQVGSYIDPAQTLFWLVSGVPWVEANFKENQLAKMRVCQPATIHVDAFPSHLFKGHVQSFSPGAGEAFSPLPAQNATGNWVKVVQRLPVRIAFDEPPPPMAGRAGLSAVVNVDIQPNAQERCAGAGR